MSRDYETDKLFAYDNGPIVSVWFKDQSGHVVDLTKELIDELNKIWEQKLESEKAWNDYVKLRDSGRLHERWKERDD